MVQGLMRELFMMIGAGQAWFATNFLGSAVYTTVRKTLRLEVDMVKIQKIVSRRQSC